MSQDAQDGEMFSGGKSEEGNRMSKDSNKVSQMSVRIFQTTGGSRTEGL